jgi:hypothetical protein
MLLAKVPHRRAISRPRDTGGVKAERKGVWKAV